MENLYLSVPRTLSEYKILECRAVICYDIGKYFCIALL